MKKIVVLGAGRSAYYLIKFLLENGAGKEFELTIADYTEDATIKFKKFNPSFNSIQIDVNNSSEVNNLLKDCFLCISVMPPKFHLAIAELCIANKCHFIHPSYCDENFYALDDKVKNEKLCFIPELGLDPGLDHLTAIDIIEQLQNKGAEIYSFQSWAGSLITKESINNPFKYKIAWNPDNIVRAGSKGGLYLKDKNQKFLPYQRIFSDIFHVSSTSGELFDGYINRNSVDYIKKYELDNIDEFVRGTLRYSGFCNLWNVFVFLGATDNSVNLNFKEGETITSFFNIFFNNIEVKNQYLKDVFPKYNFNEILETFHFLGYGTDEILPIYSGTPSDFIREILLKKINLEDADKDRVVMIHDIKYKQGDKKFRYRTVLDINGENQQETALTKTVGLPMALAALGLLKNEIHYNGLLLPFNSILSKYIVPKLSDYNLNFVHENSEIIE